MEYPAYPQHFLLIQRYPNFNYFVPLLTSFVIVTALGLSRGLKIIIKKGSAINHLHLQQSPYIPPDASDQCWCDHRSSENTPRLDICNPVRTHISTLNITAQACNLINRHHIPHLNMTKSRIHSQSIRLSKIPYSPHENSLTAQNTTHLMCIKENADAIRYSIVSTPCKINLHLNP